MTRDAFGKMTGARFKSVRLMVGCTCCKVCNGDHGPVGDDAYVKYEYSVLLAPHPTSRAQPSSPDAELPSVQLQVGASAADPG